MSTSDPSNDDTPPTPGTWRTLPLSTGGTCSAAPVVPGYEILGEIGRGGMGVVYAARQVGLNRRVALKMVLTGPHCGAEELNRFRTEAEIIARLRHPNIIQIFEVGSAAGQPFFSLELMVGSLADRLARKPLPPHEAARLVEVLAGAVQAAHELGIVHRDLKPANVLLAEDGTPRITDFGLAKCLDAPALHTRTGAVVGTPSYMAPEQAEGLGAAVGTVTDVYALGAILYEALTGRPPFLAATSWDTLLQVVNSEPVAPRRLQPQVSRDLETICLKCLNKEPEQRYPTAAALAEDLQRIRTGEPIRARPLAFWHRAARWARRRPAPAALLVAVALLAAGAVGYLCQRAAEAERRLAHREQIDRQFSEGRRLANEGDWHNAKVKFASALAGVGMDPTLEILRAPLQHSLAEADQKLSEQQTRQQALQKLREFQRLHDEALFHGMVLSGGDLPRNLTVARRAGADALALFGLAANRDSDIVLDPSLQDHRADVARRCYEVFLVLASVETDPQRALALLDRAVRLGPPTQALHYRRARCLEATGDAISARSERERGNLLGPAEALDHFLLGEDRWEEGKWPEAIREFERAVQRDSHHFWAQYHLAVGYLATQRPELARSSLANCIAQKPDFAWAYLLRGIAHARLGEFTAAEQDYEESLKRAPAGEVRYGVLLNRGMLRTQQHCFAEAEADLGAAVSLKPDWHQAHGYLARTYQEQQKYAAAAREFDRAVTVAEAAGSAIRAEDRSLLYYQRARFHLLRNDLDAAWEDLGRAMAASPILAEVYADQGSILRARHKYPEALDAYDAALRVRPDYREAYRWRGKLLAELGRNAEAVRAFDRYLALGEPDADICQARGLAQAALGNLAVAVEDYTLALRLRPEVTATLAYRAWTYLAMDATALSLADFDEVIRRDPRSADALVGRGHARAKLGQVAGAAADAEAALRVGPETPRLAWNAARVFAQAAERTEVARGPAGDSRRQYQDRAVKLLRQALEALPRDQRTAFWQDCIRRDAALQSLRGCPAYTRLETDFSTADRKAVATK